MMPITELREGKSESRPTLRDMETLVIALCSGSFVRVPPWFSAGGALQTARHNRARFVLVENKGLILAIYDDASLAAASPAQIICRVQAPRADRVPPETTWREALAFMRRTDLDLLLIASDRTVVGILTRETLERFASQNTR